MPHSPWRTCGWAGGRADGRAGGRADGRVDGRTGKRCMIVDNTSGNFYSIELVSSCLIRLVALGSLGVLRCVIEEMP